MICLPGVVSTPLVCLGPWASRPEPEFVPGRQSLPDSSMGSPRCESEEPWCAVRKMAGAARGIAASLGTGSAFKVSRDAGVAVTTMSRA